MPKSFIETNIEELEINVEESKVSLKNSKIRAEEKLTVSDNCNISAQDAVLKGKTVIYQGNTTFKGTFVLEAKDKLVTTKESTIENKQESKEETENPNVLIIKANEAEINGKVNVDHAAVEVKHISDAEEFITGDGRYSQFNTHQSLTVNTEKDIKLDQKINRECDLNVTGNSVEVNVDHHNAKQNLKFISKTGDVNLHSNLTGKNISVQSAANLTNTKNVKATEVVNFNANTINNTLTLFHHNSNNPKINNTAVNQPTISTSLNKN